MAESVLGILPALASCSGRLCWAPLAKPSWRCDAALSVVSGAEEAPTNLYWRGWVAPTFYVTGGASGLRACRSASRLDGAIAVFQPLSKPS